MQIPPTAFPKKLRSTYRPQETTLLPSGWTEHTAPTGHKYYYNTATQISTYTRPAEPVPQASPAPTAPISPPPLFYNPDPASLSFQAHPPSYSQPRQPKPPKRGPPPDRPKSKHFLPGHAPWVLVKTFLGRKFVHNPSTGQSLWKIPADLKQAVDDFYDRERKRREGIDIPEPPHEEAANPAPTTPKPASDPSDYEEIEIELSASDNDSAPPTPHKRPRLASPTQDQQPMELTEDDIAYQLAALDSPASSPDDQELTASEAQSHFASLLSDTKVNPYTTWDALLASSKASPLIADERYTLLPTTRARKTAFAVWSAAQIQQIREQKAKQPPQDPRVPYLRFLHAHASPKLYWADFKKKHRKAPELKESKLSDREREKLYREHVGRVARKSEKERKDELWEAMRKVPVGEWGTGIEEDGLPEALRADVRFIGVGKGTRERLVREFVRGLSGRGEVEK